MEAYELAMNKVTELHMEGIDVTLTLSRSRRDKEMHEKYKSPQRIPPDKWFHVTFKMNGTSDEENKLKAERVFATRSYLGMAGIRFDTGSGCGGIDWEFDWSFKYTGEENADWNQAAGEVEDLAVDLGLITGACEEVDESEEKRIDG